MPFAVTDWACCPSRAGGPHLLDARRPGMGLRLAQHADAGDASAAPATGAMLRTIRLMTSTPASAARTLPSCVFRLMSIHLPGSAGHARCSVRRMRARR